MDDPELFATKLSGLARTDILAAHVDAARMFGHDLLIRFGAA